MSSDHPIASTPVPPARLLTQLGVSDPQFLDETAIARVWRVERAGGDPAVLKLYVSGRMGNEAKGAAFLHAMNGVGAARVFAQTSSAVLMEWLPGPSLGDLSREGRDGDAAAELVGVARTLHAAPPFPTQGWPRLETWFAALIALRFAADCPAAARHAVARSQTLARDMLACAQDLRPLHSDLHHDNVRLGSRGYCAFDAKGVIGDRAYELANAFRNPKGAHDLLRDPARVRFLRDLWSDALDLAPQVLMTWAVAKTALSVAWRCKGVLSSDPELDLLDLMIGVLDDG